MFSPFALSLSPRLALLFRTKRESAAWKSMKAAFKSAERKKRNSGGPTSEEKGNVARPD